MLCAIYSSILGFNVLQIMVTDCIRKILPLYKTKLKCLGYGRCHHVLLILFGARICTVTIGQRSHGIDFPPIKPPPPNHEPGSADNPDVSSSLWPTLQPTICGGQDVVASISETSTVVRIPFTVWLSYSVSIYILWSFTTFLETGLYVQQTLKANFSPHRNNKLMSLGSIVCYELPCIYFYPINVPLPRSQILYEHYFLLST